MFVQCLYINVPHTMDTLLVVIIIIIIIIQLCSVTFGVSAVCFSNS